MDLQALTTFFMWCTIMNGGFLILWTSFVVIAPEFMYRTQSQWFPMPRETFNMVIYSLLGLYKILLLLFNLVPYVALLIVG